MQKVEELINSGEKLAFLIGSGVSMVTPSNLPSGQEFNKEILDIISPDDDTKSKLEQLVKNSESPDRENKGDFLRFEGLIQQFYNNGDEDLSILDYLSLSEEPNINHHILAQLIEKGHYVFTTNFDILIEIASTKQRVSQIIRDNEFKDYLENSNKYENPLFKLHGSLKEYKDGEYVNSKDSVQATLDTVGKTEGDLQFEPGKFEVFKNILQNHHLIIMGYSGYDDFDIGPMIKDIESDKKIVWVNHSYDYKEYTMEEILDSDKDKSREYLIKRFEILGDLYSNKKRKEENVILMNINSDYVGKELINGYGLGIPDLEGKLGIDKKVFREFFKKWGKEMFGVKGAKELLCGHIFYSLGRNSEALEEYSKSLEIYKELGDKSGIASSLRSIGIIHQERGEDDQALEFYKKSLKISKELRDKSGIAISLNNIGVIHRYRGDYDQALELYNQSLGIFKELGYKRKGIPISLMNIGIIHQEKGYYDQALQFYKRSLEMSKELGDKSGIANSLGNIGNIHKERGDYYQALEIYKQSLEISKELGDKSGIAMSLNNIGNIHKERGDYDQALEVYKQSLETSKELGDKSGFARSLINIGRIHQERGEYNQVLEVYKQSLEIDKELGDKSGIASSLGNIGNIHKERGDYDQALEVYKQSFEIKKELGDKSGFASSLNNIGIIHQERGEYDQALEFYKKSLKISKELRDKSGIAISLNNIGIIHKERGEYYGAMKNIHKAFSIFEELGSPNKNIAQNTLEKIMQEIGEEKYKEYLEKIKKEPNIL